jgi:phosphoserine phosphatase
MKTYSIIWDFDGTLMPNDPYDSEQSLLMYKLYESEEKVSFVLRTLTRIFIYADNHEHLRKTFKRFYAWFLKGTSVNILDEVSQHLAAKISETDRQAIVELKRQGYTMMVLSCGTADLSERALKIAGLDDCFDVIEGNRFEMVNDQISGMVQNMNNPDKKVKYLQHKGIRPDQTVAIGDGYTDIPLLEWAQIPIMMDRTGKKKALYGHKNYKFISEISEILTVL